MDEVSLNNMSYEDLVLLKKQINRLIDSFVDSSEIYIIYDSDNNAILVKKSNTYFNFIEYVDYFSKGLIYRVRPGEIILSLRTLLYKKNITRYIKKDDLINIWNELKIELNKKKNKATKLLSYK